MLDAMLCTGFPYDVHLTRDDIVALFGEFVGRARAVRRLGSAALDLCYVAAARLDGFWEQRLKPWDTAAGALIVEEAGGRVTRWNGGPFDPRRDDLVASNGVIHDQMLGIIRDHESSRSGKGTR
jgi:myo-inositol-1(or 4)-monophosphatase